MLFVDDITIILIFKRNDSELCGNLCFEFCNQLIPDAAFTEQKIRSHAGLPAVQIFAENNPACSQL